MQYITELEKKDMLLQVTLQEKEEEMNLVKGQYEHQFHKVKNEKERLQQQIQGYERMLQQNNKQIEVLRREYQQRPAMMGPVGERYPMSNTPHGIAVIINNINFKRPQLYKRIGSEFDEHNLSITWEYLQYDVRILRDLTTSELRDQLTQIALQSHEKYDSFVCCILSHGDLDCVYGTDGNRITVNDIARLFRGDFCPTLAGKPKLFFIEAARGDHIDKGVFVWEDDKDKVVTEMNEHKIVVEKDKDKAVVVKDEDKVVVETDEDKAVVKDEDQVVVKDEDQVVVKKDEDKGVVVQKDDDDKVVMQDDVHKDAKGDPEELLRHSLPSEADFLFGYATSRHYVSWRRPPSGTWYISKLCEVLMSYATQLDLLSMLTIVNQKVSETYCTTEGYRQCPAPVSLLRKQVWFFENPSK